VAASIGLWWLYFDVLSRATEDRFSEQTGADRVRMGLEAYTYGHFPVVAGIIITAVGVEGVLAHADDSKGLGTFYALPLYGGVGLYLLGVLLVKRRVLGTWSTERLAALALVLATMPLAIVLPPLGALGLLVAVLSALIVVETLRHSATRRLVRSAH
jgi:low temperature requirement protein LtrA